MNRTKQICREQYGQHDEAVRASFLRNSDGTGVQRQEQRGNNSNLAVEQPSPDNVHQWDGENSRDDREQAYRAFSITQVQPGPQQHVVRGHVAFVVPQKMPEDRSGAAGDGDAGDFVDPEALVTKRNQPENRAQPRR